jgi:3-phosphoshikimate 1-carboxyvinyltransferase
MIAALAEGSTRLTNALFSDDTGYFAGALQTLGFDVQLDPVRSEMVVTGLGGEIPATQAELFIGNAGTAARFLSAFLTLGHGHYTLDGDERMRQRPIGDLVAALTQAGAKLEAVNDCPPVKIIAAGLPGGKVSMAGDISSQFLSGLLIVAPYAKQAVEIYLSTGLNSKPYVDMTLAVMQDFGVQVKRNGYEFFFIPHANYQLPNNRSAALSLSKRLITYPIESDASAASYFFAAPVVLGGVVRVDNISRRSKQGDIRFLEVLERMGCSVTEGPDYIEVTAGSSLIGLDVDLSDMPDTAQTLAAIAPFASTPTRIHGIASARAKETDRIAATCTELARLGVRVEEHTDGMTIFPCEALRPSVVQTYHDHRMAMAFSLIGLRIPGVTIENPACVAKTFPNFFEVLDTLR